MGSRVSSDGTTNRVAVTNAVTLQSVNGATVTVIDGGNAVRCVYLSSGAVLAGFKLTKGNATNGAGVYCASTNAQLLDCHLTSNSGKYGGGVYSGTLSNCTLSGNTVGFYGSGAGACNSVLAKCTLSGNAAGNMGSGGGAAGSVLNNCTLTGNVTGSGMSGATVGGGATGSTLNNCTLSNNQSLGAGASGGGAYGSKLNNCTLAGNLGDHSGGGAASCTLTNCILSNNRANYGGGGVVESTLQNCVLTGNDGYGDGGAAYWSCTLNNCLLYNNRASYGGGAYSCTLNNCTVVGNSSTTIYASGGGAYGGTLNNCIVYYNTGGGSDPNIYSATLRYSCAPSAVGAGNITNAPLFVNQAGGNLRLQAGSPGINAGTNGIITSMTDLDGNMRIVDGTIDMGAYEFHYANPLIVFVQANYTNVVVGYPVTFSGVFNGGRSDSWDFGDGTEVSNQWTVSHAWSSLGDQQVTLTVYDDNYPAGVSAFFTVHVIAPPVAYVDPGSTNPVPPFSSWQTAATNIQDAVEGVDPGYHILVTNSVWQTGGRVIYGSLTNRLAVTKPVVVESVNGPALTVIQGNPVIGDSAVRCVYLTHGATLSGFTLLSGATRAAGDSYQEQSGGGIWCESTNALILDCVVASNSASLLGGGVYRGTLKNCTLSSNATILAGGGAYASVLADCLLLSNSAVRVWPPDAASGGGADSCILSNCALIGNLTANWQNDAPGGGANNSVLDHCVLTNNTAGQGGAANNSTLRNCVLFANSSAGPGGGATGSTLSDCLVISNSASGGSGGGADGCALRNCIISGNTSTYQGGGANGGTVNNSLLTWNSTSGSRGGGVFGATLTNCTVVGNSAFYWGGGADSCTAWNSMIVDNTAPDGSNWYAGTLNYCCTTPLSESGIGNITNVPLFVNPLGGDFQLHSNSPGINAGTNAYALAGLDLAGNLRIVGGTVDMGAYECQSPALLAYYAWLQTYELSTHSSAVYADSDGDHMNNWQEWIAGTIPTNVASVLRLFSPTRNGSGLIVTWQSVTNRTYFIERSSNLGAHPTFLTLATNIAGQLGTTSYTDTNAVGPWPFCYRVGIQTDAYQAHIALSVIPFGWLQVYDLPTDGSVDYVDTDGDRLNNWEEWRAGTDPTQASSVLKMLAASNGGLGITVTWQSVGGVNYYLQRSSLSGSASFSTLQSNIVGQAGSTSYTDTNAVGSGPFFYRVGVQ